MRRYPLYEADYYDDFQSFTQGIAQKYADRPAVTVYTRKGEERTHSYAELAADASALSRALCEAGLQGEHIAIVGENSYEWVVSFLGVTGCGAVAVAVDIDQPAETIRHMITQADARVVLASSTLEPICAPLLGQAVSRLLLLDELYGPADEQLSADTPERASTLKRLCAIGKVLLQAEEQAKTARPDPDQTAMIVYTSGTTSVQKPVMLSQQGILHNASGAVSYLYAQGRLFTALPLYHTYGLTCALLSNLILGMHICINGDLKTMMRDFRAFDPHAMMSVPLIVETIHKGIWDNIEKAGKKDAVRRLMQINRFLRGIGLSFRRDTLDGIRKKAVGSLWIVICGGAHLSRETALDMLDLGVLILQGYGITECSPLVSVNRNKYYDMNSVGPVLPSCQVRIVEGEIWVRGISVMQGYYKNRPLTDEAMEDGWFKTGDMGYLDQRGFLFISGRKKNLIVFKNGKKVAPEEIEEYILQIPTVKEVVAYGAASGSSTDDVRLGVSIYPDPQKTAGMSSYQILEHLQAEIDRINRTLPPYKQIQMINIRDSEFSKTPLRKIQRYKI